MFPTNVELYLCYIKPEILAPFFSCFINRGLSSFRFRERIAITETQEGLNHVAVCNVHKKYIDKLHLMAIPIANEFIALNERRMQLFGKF